MKQRTKIEQLVDREIARISASPIYFFKRDIVTAVLDNSTLRNGIKAADKAAPGWDFPIEIRKLIDAAAGKALQARDAFGIRVYECYPAGEPERRWMRLRSMTHETLLIVLQETRVQERTLRVKGAGYHLFSEALAALASDATIDLVYDAVAPKIRNLRAA